MVWYLVPDEEGTGDGGHVGFLDPTPRNLRRFSDCDPPLYDALGEIVEDDDRSVRAVRERGVLPRGRAFYEASLSFASMPGIGREAKERRLERRKAWAWDALAASRGCDLVFADPDNGLEVEGKKPHTKRGPKYAYFDELRPYLDRGQSLVVFQSRDRTSVEHQMQERLSQVHDQLGRMFALFHRPYAGRSFFVVPSEAHWQTLYEGVVRLARHRCWSEQFTLYGPEGPE